MKRKSLLFGLLAVLSAVLIFTGCANPADGSDGAPGGTGGTGEKGADGPSYLSGPHTTAGIQDAIDSGVPVVFAGVVQSDSGVVTIPAGRNVKLVGDAAYSVITSKTATLIVTDSTAILPTSTGKIAKGAGDLTVVAPQSVLSASVASDVIPVTIYNSFEEIEGTPTTLALAGPVEIVSSGTSSGKTIKAGDLSTVTGQLYVVGELTVSADLTITPLYVTGKAKFDTTSQTGIKSVTAGSVESSVAITGASNADITVTGELKTTAAVTLAGTGKLDAGSLNLAGNLTTATGAVTVKGASVLGGNVSRTSGVYSFGGDVTIADGKSITLTSTDTVTLAKGAAIKVDSDTVLSAPNGDVVITPVTGAVLTAASKKIAVGTAGIAFKGTLAVSGELEANAKDITVTSVTGILAINADGKVTTKGAATAGAIILGDATNGVTLTGAGSWTATGSTVTLTQTGADAATIGKTGSAAATLTASGTAPAINVLVGSTGANVLTIGGGTEIALAGTSSKVGSIVLTNSSDKQGDILFAGVGAKISTGNTATAIVGNVAGGIVANSGTVGSELEVYSSATSGSSLKLGSIVPVSGALFGGTNNKITGPTGTDDTTISSELTVTS
jgi:hypothetical protein